MSTTNSITRSQRSVEECVERFSRLDLNENTSDANKSSLISLEKEEILQEKMFYIFLNQAKVGYRNFCEKYSFTSNKLHPGSLFIDSREGADKDEQIDKLRRKYSANGRLKKSKKDVCGSIDLCDNLASRIINDIKQENKKKFLISLLVKNGKVDFLYFINDSFGLNHEGTIKKIVENLDKEKYLLSLKKELSENKQEILKIYQDNSKQWRPQHITKQSIEERVKDMQGTLTEALKVYLKEEEDSDPSESIGSLKQQQIAKRENIEKELFESLKKITSSHCTLNKHGLIELSKEFDLICTSNNNRYLVFKKLKMGEGSSKRVCLGLDLTKNRPVALGYIQNEIKAERALSNEEAVYCELSGKRLTYKHEIKNKKLIIKYIDFIQFSKSAVMVSELCKEDLEKNIENQCKRQKKENNVKRCQQAIQIACELHEAERDVRDFKPSNLFINLEGNLVLGDLDRSGGTFFYHSPEELVTSEQRRALRNARGKTEQKNFINKVIVWSLGMILFQTYCGVSESQLDDAFRKLDKEKGFAWDRNDPDYLAHCRETTVPFLINEVKVFTDKCREAKSPDLPFLEIIQSMLEFNPTERPSLHEVQTQWNQAIAMQQEADAMEVAQNSD